VVKVTPFQTTVYFSSVVVALKTYQVYVSTLFAVHLTVQALTTVVKVVLSTVLNALRANGSPLVRPST
jgi:hypothetical protein